MELFCRAYKTKHIHSATAPVQTLFISLARHTYFSTRARATCAFGIGGTRGKIRMGTNDVLVECNFRFKTSDYHVIKQADIMARCPFCIVSLHVEHRKPYSPASELALPLLCPWRIAGTHCVRCSIQVMLTGHRRLERTIKLKNKVQEHI